MDLEKESEIKIWLIDPTYTQQQISHESMPSAIGGIATFTEKHLKLKHSIRLFKYPEKLAKALDNEIPDVIGFSNYIWNCELSLAIARRIKEYAADTLVIMGGPNYSEVSTEQEIFLRKHPEIDFYVKGEGEVAFANLIAEIIRAGMKKSNLRHRPIGIGVQGLANVFAMLNLPFEGKKALELVKNRQYKNLFEIFRLMKIHQL